MTSVKSALSREPRASLRAALPLFCVVSVSLLMNDLVHRRDACCSFLSHDSLAGKGLTYGCQTPF